MLNKLVFSSNFGFHKVLFLTHSASTYKSSIFQNQKQWRYKTITKLSPHFCLISFLFQTSGHKKFKARNEQINGKINKQDDKLAPIESIACSVSSLSILTTMSNSYRLLVCLKLFFSLFLSFSGTWRFPLFLLPPPLAMGRGFQTQIPSEQLKYLQSTFYGIYSLRNTTLSIHTI